MEKITVIPTQFGSVGIVAGPQGLSNLILTKRKVNDARSYLQRLYPQAQFEKQLLPSLQRQLRDYFAGRPVRFQAKIDLSSLTTFQQQVLKTCAKIDYGKTISYGQLAQRIGKPKAARAVGGALARNPIPIVIPCHRVIAVDGSMRGFSAEQGISLKKKLLKMEADVMDLS
ncbi:MAG: methylated-DNA--[protein]-cysteine S-methyltransferase [Planctomycetota bacterium]|jgi:methylated-DNA-[protein]-cysteine S-methyltransferase